MLPAVARGQDVPRQWSAPRPATVRFVEEDHDDPVEPFPVTPGHGREKTSLTLVELEAIALQSNPSLAAWAASVDAARGRWLQAGLYPNPIVGYHATEIGNLNTAGQQGGFFSQRFITGAKLQLDRAAADQQVWQVEHQFDAQRQRVLSDVRIRFYDALVAQRRVELTSQLARIGDEAAHATEKLLQARQVSPNALLQAEIESESAKILFENAQNERLESWRRLAAVVGAASVEATELVGDLDRRPLDYTWQHCMEYVLAQNPDLLAAWTRVERASLALTRARREWIPNVDVSISVRHHNVSASDVANVQVGIPIPIFDANQGNIQRASAELGAARSVVAQIRLEIQDRLAVVFRRYLNARQQVERYSDRILPRANEALDLVTAGYQQRQVDYLTLLTTQRTYFRVSLAYLASLRELRETEIVIDGQLLLGSLSRRP